LIFKEVYMKKMNNQKGFTLVEMAIVLVIGGMMLGAVMKGQGMIETFRAKKLITDIESISIACLTYFNMYNALPGDDSSNHGWAGVTGGNGNGWIDGGAEDDGIEAHEAWQALRRTGILRGNPAATGTVQFPVTPYGSRYYLGNRSFGAGVGKRNYVRVNHLTGILAESIDIKYDDGIYNTGSVHASDPYTNDNVDLYYSI
jgi:prepilin-type N-terminal cleavage/methylation domain-containing protein